MSVNKTADFVEWIERDTRTTRLYSPCMRQGNGKSGRTPTLFCLRAGSVPPVFELIECAAAFAHECAPSTHS